MPLQRFRSLDEARRALWLEPGDPAILRSMRAVWSLGKLGPDVPPERGVKKFRTIEEANADREAWIRRCVAAARARVKADL